MNDKPRRNKTTKSAKRARPLADSELREASGGMFDAYLQIDGIKGESQEDQHKDWIEVLSYKKSTSPTRRR